MTGSFLTDLTNRKGFISASHYRNHSFKRGNREDAKKISYMSLVYFFEKEFQVFKGVL